jgi:hypothetical protein
MSHEMSLKEAARAIRTPYNSVWYWYKQGKLPIRKIAGRNMIAPRTLRRTLRTLGYRPKSHGVTLQETI